MARELLSMAASSLHQDWEVNLQNSSTVGEQVTWNYSSLSDWDQDTTSS